jgi:hypothetical protein
MSRRYDSRTTIFSPEGRLYQVEYALEAISHAGTALGILAKDGIVLAAERKVTSKLLEQDTSAEKLYTLNEFVDTFHLHFTITLTSLKQHDLRRRRNDCRCQHPHQLRPLSRPKLPPHLQPRDSL